MFRFNVSSADLRFGLGLTFRVQIYVSV